MASSSWYRRYTANAAWIIAEKVVKMGLAFLGLLIMTRYLGAEQYGILVYATSMALLFAVIGHLGLSGLVVRDIVDHVEERGLTLGTTLVLKTIGFVTAYVLLLGIAVLSHTSRTESLVVAIIGGTLLLRPLELVLVMWFEAHVQARYCTMGLGLGYTVTFLCQLALVYSGASLLWFAAAPVVGGAVAAGALLLLYHRSSDLPVRQWRYSGGRAKLLVSQGWMIFLGSCFAMIYLKIDLVMLRWLAGAAEVGVYSVAATLSEAWYFLPLAIVASVFPRLVELKRTAPEAYQRRLQQLLDLLFAVSFVIAVTVTVCAKPLIRLLLEPEFAPAATILMIHIWAGPFIFMRAVFSRWILIENALVFSVVTQGAGALLNILLNLALIPRMGGGGAALATLLSYASASYFVLLASRQTHPIFRMMTRAMVSPMRYLAYIVRSRAHR